jgi:hypothetical protein
MMGDIFSPTNPLLTVLAGQYTLWQQATAALEDATRRFDQDAAMVATDNGMAASRQVNVLTNGHPDAAIEQRWVAAITAWNNAGFGLPSQPTTSTPTWIWGIVLVLGLAALRKRGR